MKIRSVAIREEEDRTIYGFHSRPRLETPRFSATIELAELSQEDVEALYRFMRSEDDFDVTERAAKPPRAEFPKASETTAPRLPEVTSAPATVSYVHCPTCEIYHPVDECKGGPWGDGE